MDVFPQGLDKYTAGGVEINPKKRVLSAKFGNGYGQVAEDGINSDESVYNITWENVPLKDAEIIFRFLAPKLNIIPFQIDIPSVGMVQVKCAEVKRTYTDNFVNSITAQLQRDYTIAP